MKTYSDDLAFYIDRMEYKQAFNMPEMHMHEAYEVYYQMSGGRNYFIEDKFYSTKRGDVLIIAPGIRHKTTYAGIKNYQRFLLHFKPEFFSQYDTFIRTVSLMSSINKFAVVELGNSDREKVEFLLFNMLEDFDTHPENYLLNLELMLKEFLIWLDRSYTGAETGPVNSPSIYRIISDICLHLQMNYTQDIKLEDLAGRFKLSSFYLSRKFKEITKHSIPQYVNTIRLEISKELLKATDLSITDIAVQIGYGNSSHFARVFKQYLEITPQQYRKQKTEF